MIQRLQITAVLAALLAGAAFADTFYLKNGTRLDGEVKKEQGGTVTVEIGNRTVAFRTSEILRIEQNDRTGGFDLQKARAAAETRSQELLKLTGLTAEQRAAVKKVMWDLQSSDPEVSAKARRELVAMGQGINLVKYFEYYLPSLSPRFVAGVLEVVCELDKTKAKEMLRRESTNVDARSRAKALELMGKVGDTAGLDIVARGMVDPSAVARAAAAQALGMLGAKSATPVLIANFRIGDVTMQSACRRALSQLWSAEQNVVDFKSVEEWEQLWQERAAEVSNPIQVSALTPLVHPEAKFEDE